MGLTFRKSIKIGTGTRLNLSTSGIGVSTGVKGFRISTGSRGTFITIGGHGIYYREKIGGPYGMTKLTDPFDGVKTSGEEQITLSAEAVQITSSEATSILAEINETTNLPSQWPMVAAITFCLVVAIQLTILIALWCFNKATADLQITPFILFISSVTAIVPTLIAGNLAAKNDADQHTYRIQYSLDDDALKRYDGILKAILVLNQNKKIFCVVSSLATPDSKYNAGAEVYDRILVAKCNYSKPPFLETNYIPLCLDLGHGNQKLYFMPDRIYVYQKGAKNTNEYGASEYDSIEVASYTQKEVTDPLTTPSDAEIIGKTYDKVNKDGSRDRRFNRNSELNICRVGRIEFKSPQGLSVLLQVSKYPTAGDFVQAYKLAVLNLTALNGTSDLNNHLVSNNLAEPLESAKHTNEPSSQPTELIEGGYLPCPNCGYFNTPLDKQCCRCHAQLLDAFENDLADEHRLPSSGEISTHVPPSPKIG